MKFLVNWCSAFLKDLKSHGTGDTITKQQLLEMRAQYPNILVDEKKWDEQIEAQRVADSGTLAYCIHPSVHADTHRGTVPAMAKHKETCWQQGNN